MQPKRCLPIFRQEKYVGRLGRDAQLQVVVSDSYEYLPILPPNSHVGDKNPYLSIFTARSILGLSTGFVNFNLMMDVSRMGSEVTASFVSSYLALSFLCTRAQAVDFRFVLVVQSQGCLIHQLGIFLSSIGVIWDSHEIGCASSK